MHFAEREAMVSVGFNAAEKSAAIADAGKTGRNHAGLVFITEPHERCVHIREFVVQAHVEIVARLPQNRRGLEIQRGIIENVGRRVEHCQPRAQRIDGSIREDIRRIARQVHANGHAAKTIGIQIRGLGKPGVEDFARECRATRAVAGYLSGGQPGRRVNRKSRAARQGSRKIASHLRRSGYEQRHRLRLTNTQAGVVHKEKSPVMSVVKVRNDYRPPEGHAKLVLFVRRNLRRIKGVARIELFVPQIFVHASVPFISARFYGGVDNGAVAAPEFRAIRVGLHFEFLECVERRLNHVVRFVQQVGKVGIVVNPVEQKIVLQGTRAVGAEAKTLFIARPRFAGHGAGNRERQLSEVTSV